MCNRRNARDRIRVTSEHGSQIHIAATRNGDSAPQISCTVRDPKPNTNKKSGDDLSQR